MMSDNKEVLDLLIEINEINVEDLNKTLTELGNQRDRIIEDTKRTLSGLDDKKREIKKLLAMKDVGRKPRKKKEEKNDATEKGQKQEGGQK